MNAASQTENSTIIAIESVTPTSLIEKYRCEGPRYTSYPTALQFSEAFTPAQHLDLLKHSGQQVAPLSLYVHLPFCRWLCYYCACNKIVTKDPSASRRYLDYLAKEIEMVSSAIGKHRRVVQLHLGGGTPTYFDDAELTELIHMLSSHFRFADDQSREYAIEIDPRTVDGDRLALLKGLGFNRLSFGVQDSDPAVQKAINRVCPTEKLVSLFKQARELRFKSLSVDLIYGLPKQTCTTLEHTLDEVLELAPDRIAFYHYAHLPDRFPPQKAIAKQSIPDSAEKLALYQLATRRFEEAGYIHIGMDHFVKPDDALAQYQQEGRLQRNFQGYSTSMAPDTLALGVSAISSLDGNFNQNHVQLDDYYRALDEGHLPTAKGLICNEEDRIRRALISALICNLQLDIPTFEQRFQINFNRHFKRELEALQQLANDGLLTLSEQAITVTQTGRNFLRNICMTFDTYLHGVEGRFSKTL
ncbi:oxygen-independent coproporphyrinogen III oxidase [Spongiibacter sp. KMU-158]|uniref:Coproporphyrinogen-III oxidase n=1 Tax=Spongiibacter pelagi TaxID=2760804 RepID=A0A927C020_9GAMM|nr:oxygen-independent coproporphyrinogen III oxidase [Spongiibacter pelagi]MBD2858219.1 oxygen-independent coproporphyrinogen III oxidase [Spongiibacter pelagi]